MKKLFVSAVSIFVGMGFLVSCGGLNNSGQMATISGIASRSSGSGFLVMGVQVKTKTPVANGAAVTVQGLKNSDGSIAAETVTVSAEIKGNISSIDTAGSSLVVLGQTIKVDANTVFEISDSGNLNFAALKVADFVEVHGLRQADASLLASRIELKTGTVPSEVEVRGMVSGLDIVAKTFLLGTQQVSYGSLNSVMALNNGLWVQVKGALNNFNVLVASKLDTKTYVLPKAGERVELEGIVSGLDAAAKVVTIQGYSVNYSNAVVTGMAVNGAKAEVHGTFIAGAISAQEIEFDSAQKGFADADSKHKGVIAAIDAATKGITIDGVVYFVDDNTVLEQADTPITFANLTIGAFVEIKFVNSSKLIRKLEVD